MIKFFLAIALVMALGWLFGCSNSPQKPIAQEQPPFYVPSTVLLQTTDNVARINPYQVLASSDAEDYFVGRDEKAVYGATVLAESSAYTTYTYDAQRISGPLDDGFKYRWVVQQGITFP